MTRLKATAAITVSLRDIEATSPSPMEISKPQTAARPQARPPGSHANLNSLLKANGLLNSKPSATTKEIVFAISLFDLLHDIFADVMDARTAQYLGVRAAFHLRMAWVSRRMISLVSRVRG